ncbi:hypothetical protein TRSC58_02337 [Trypanosoma rangeli SC58]|uniref:Present in the outer mitochondrial membrane proteome 7 n=1 Tax=Trypanosoma rangeli SC58 TaxID=429131 RepID=A0A061J719_TRYRA|nr:hypothetical protein TRSC58_02337 [Trypanosoma rangeli SC58]
MWPPSVIAKMRLLVEAGGVILFMYVVCRQTGRLVQSRKKKASESQSEEDAAVFHHRSAQTVPVEVVVENLSAGWTTAPPIFYPPNLAVIPILRSLAVTNGGSAEQNIFILCDGPRPRMLQAPAGDEKPVAFYMEYLLNMPLFQTVATREATVLPLNEAGFSCETECFTHAAIIPDNKTVIVFGSHGPYILSFVLTQYASSALNLENDMCTAGNLTPGDVEMLLGACSLVPLVNGLCLPGTPAGARKGSLRLTYRHGNNILVFALSSLVAVRQNVERDEKRNKDALDPLFFLEGDVLPDKKIAVGGDTLDALVKGISVDALFPSSTPAHPLVSSLFSLVTVEELVACVENGAGDCAPPLYEDDVMKIVFSHPYLGVSFSVNPKSGVVYEPILTKDLLLLYYPLGDEARYSLSSGPREDDAPPRVSLRHLTQLPPTWEKLLSTEDELKHNVLFHFTDWTRERVSCSMCDVNGLQGVQLFESKEDHSCRTYVIPRDNAILVIRWETKTRDWAMYLPLLQKFLDSLLLEDFSA